MYAYHRLWLTLLILAIVTSSMCGFANEHDVSENANLLTESHVGASQSDTALKGLNGSELAEDLSLNLHSSLRFEPPFIDFGRWSVGTVHSQTVTLVNSNRNRSVYLSSVSCETLAFSSSFFEASMVPPNSNTTFNVVFLPREQGAISTSLQIHTSFGKLQLEVGGEGQECPYRLKPLVGIRAPLNATLMPEIHMYNPHQKTLQVLEVYSSGGHFQLELPSGANEAPKGLWEIPPLTTKPVIRIRFQGYTAGNYSAFIRIKIAEPSSLNNSDAKSKNEEQILVIPVEFEILPKYGVYAVNPLLEFGQIAADVTKLKVLRKKLFLKHSKSQLEVNDVEFVSMSYLSGVFYQNNTTTIELNPHEFDDEVVHLNERVELYLKDKTAYTYHIDLMIRADIYKGILHYNVNETLFLIDEHRNSSNRRRQAVEVNDINKTYAATAQSSLDSRLLRLRNDFKIPLAIYNIKSSGSDSIKLSLQIPTFEMDGGLTLKPGCKIDLLVSITLKRDQKESQQESEKEDLEDLKNYKTVIYVFTNLTNFEIPIVLSTARLFITTQTQTFWRYNTSVYTKELNLGSVLLQEVSKDGFIILQNRNSIPIPVHMSGVEKPQGVYYQFHYRGSIQAGDLKKNNQSAIDLVKSNYSFSPILEEGDVAVYSANIKPYFNDYGKVYFKISTQYENITVAFKFTTALGRLEVDQQKLHFANCFPGKLCTSELSIRSTFRQPVYVKYLNFTYPGLKFEEKTRTGCKIAPQTVTTIGRVYFEPSALCGTRCYIQQTDESSVFNNFNDILNLSSDIPDFDEVEIRRRIELYKHFKNYFNLIDFTLTTKEMQNFQLNLMLELEWPKLVSNRLIVLNGEANKLNTHEIKIVNPSDEPILVDYSLSQSIHSLYKRIYLPIEVITLSPDCHVTDKPAFSLVEGPPKNPILIPGLSNITLPIRFQADNIGARCALLRIRNNLTLYEAVWITVKVLQSQFRLGNRKPGSQTPLLFEVSEEQLASACPANDKILNVVPQVSLRRVFTARNSGEMPIRIDGFWIGNQACKGYGFEIIDCSSFELKPNSSKKIEISYHTDFSAARVSIPLTLKTNLTYEVSYILVAQLSSNGLKHCASLLPRPPWEHKIRNAAIVMLLITFILVLIAVHIDYGNIIYNQSVLYQAREKGIVHPTFNLRNIAMRSTLQNNESSIQTNDSNNRSDGKVKLSTTDKYDINSSTSTLGLKRRNVKNSKAASGDAKSVSTSGGKTMFFADMVSWTFGSKNSKKSTISNNKNVKSCGDQTNSNVAPAAAAVQATKNDIKAPVKPKLTEKTLIDKMDSDLKKLQTFKKAKTSNDKGNNKNVEKTEDDVKRRSEENVNKDTKKDKSSPKLSGKSNDSNTLASKANKEQRKSIDLTSQDIFYESNSTTTPHKNQYSPKQTSSNNRKIGKTPGRERRKQLVQSFSPTTSDITTSSCSSSTSSSCSSNHNANKRNERKYKVKASNSLKFHNNVNNAGNVFPPASSSASSSPTSLTSTKTLTKESYKTHLDILTPWDCSSQVSFSDVLQKPHPQCYSNSKLQETFAAKNESLFNDLLSSDSQTVACSENPEIVSALTPKKPKNPATDLGPIGSRKSPSSTPIWEPLQSAITVQFPRPINDSTTVTASSSSSSATTFSNFGFNNNLTSSITTQIPSALQQQQQDIQAQLLVLQRQLLEQQHLQQQQQHQYLNTNALNNNWSSSLWGPILSTPSTTANSNNTTSVFNNPTTPIQNSTWSLTTAPITSPTSSLVRPPPGLEQSFSLTTGINSPQTPIASSTSAITSSNLSTTFNNTMASATNNNNDNDNMPMFNLFGGLSSIWNDNWKEQSTSQQQPSPSNEQ